MADKFLAPIIIPDAVTFADLHLARDPQTGAVPDAVQDDLIAEARAEDERGHGQSYPPGRD